MGTLITKRVSSLQTALVLAALSIGGVACGDDSNPTPGGNTPITVPDGGKVTTLDGGVGLDSGLSDGGALDSGTAPTTCVSVNNCVCSPKSNKELLNSCTSGSCVPFDNTTRIPGFTGTLPALP